MIQESIKTVLDRKLTRKTKKNVLKTDIEHKM